MSGARAAFVLALALLGPARQIGEVELSELELRRVLTHSPLGPLPPDPTNAHADDPRAARLGQRLFFEPRVSRNGELSCASCHDPAQSFADGKQVGEGLGQGTRNTRRTSSSSVRPARTWRA
jgi:cytochrome c peroxidase